MKKIVFIFAILLPWIGCSQTDISCEQNANKRHRNIIKRTLHTYNNDLHTHSNDIYNGYEHDERIHGRYWNQDAYYKILFHKDSTYYVTKKAYSCEIKNKLIKKIKYVPYICIYVRYKRDYKNLCSVTKPWFVKAHIGIPTWSAYTAVFTIENSKQILRKDQYNTWMVEHPKTQILEY